MSDLKITPVVSAAEADGGEVAAPDGQLLVLVLDINPNQPFFARRPSLLVHFLDAALALLNAHLMQGGGNAVAAVAAHAQGCTFLYPAADDDGHEDAAKGSPDAQFEGFHRLESAVRARVKSILRRETEPTSRAGDSESLLSGALGMALCYVNRAAQEAAEGGGASAGSAVATGDARILVMSASGDTTSQYMSYMNAFFSAQKMQVCIDTCMVEQDSGLLQQGADITGGTYQKVTMKHFPALLQFLIWMFLPDAAMRSQLSLPSAERVDYRAACFCHRQLVDIGYVCSVCLSIFCKFSPMCTTCHTVFKTPGLMLPAKRKKVAKAGSGDGNRK